MESPTSDDKKEAKSPQSDTGSLCSCSASQKEVGASGASSPVTGDKGQSQPPGAGHMTGAESNKVVTVIMSSGNLFPQSLTFKSLKK